MSVSHACMRYLATTAVEYIHEYILNLVPTAVYVGTCTTTKSVLLLNLHAAHTRVLPRYH